MIRPSTSGKFHLLCAVSLCVLLAAAPASAFKWTVQHPAGTPFSKCTVLFHDKTPNNGSADLSPGGSYTWTSGNNGTSPLFYVSGRCEYLWSGMTQSLVLKMRSCDGQDLTNMISADIQCSTPEVRLKICPKDSGYMGNYGWGFCPQ